MLRWLARWPRVEIARGVSARARWSSGVATINGTSTTLEKRYLNTREAASIRPDHAISSGNDGPSLEARSLLRALLREGSYLPDSFARQWVKQHVLASFRNDHTKTQRRQGRADLERRLRNRLKDGRGGVSELQRAASGDLNRLQRVLMMAHGRIGKRRRELLRPLLQLSADESMKRQRAAEMTRLLSHDEAHTRADGGGHLTLESHESTITDKLTNKYQPRPLPPKLESLLRSQMQSAPPTLTRPNPRRLKPDIPELNTWLRPMPQNRVKNMHKKHYALLLDRALPPMPRREWERLRDLASGKSEPELLKPRRSLGTATHDADRSKMQALDVVVRYGKVPRRVTQHPHESPLAKRAMRRIYAKVFSQCPLMESDEETQTWRVTWGEQALLERSKVAEK